MWKEHSSPTFPLLVAVSIVAHIVLVVVVPRRAETATVVPAPKTFVTFETVMPAPPPKVEETPAPQARVAAPRAPRPVVTHRAAPVTTAPPLEAPVDFSGVTLSNEASNWSSPVGNGEAITAPIVATPSTPSVRTTRGAATGDRVVAVGDLSRPPKAPNLDTALAANYPADARRAGTTGTAVVRARILADGTVGAIRVVSESVPGFGNACKRTLTGSHWQAPLDARSAPAITDINYTCTFAVAH